MPLRLQRPRSFPAGVTIAGLVLLQLLFGSTVLRAGDRTAIIPVAGSTPGAFGANFRTSLQLHNPGSDELRGRLVFRSIGQPGSSGDPSLEFEIAPRGTIAFADVVASLGTTGLGSIDVISESGLPVAVVRAFNDSGSEGTRGVTVPLVPASEATGPGQRLVIIAPIDPIAARLNIGVRTLSEGARVAVSVYGADGTLRSALGERTFDADYFEQRPAADFLGAPIEAGESIVMLVREGSAIVYATMTDNRTNDPSIQLATRFGNHPPVAEDAAARTSGNASINLELRATDPDGEPLRFTIASPPLHGTLGELTHIDDTTASVTYTPASGFEGEDSFRFGVEDQNGGMAEAAVSITVGSASESAPLAVDDSFATDEDVSLAVDTPGVLANDSDPDAEPLTASLVTSPTNGTLSLAADGSFVYTPAADFFGSDSFTYRAENGTEASDPATVTITVSPVNDAPGFTAGPELTIDSAAGGVRTIEGWASSISAGPPNESEQNVTFEAGNSEPSLFSTQPSVSAASGNLTFTPVAGAQGLATITLVLRDDGGTANGGVDTSAPLTFTIQLDASPRVMSTVPAAGASGVAPASSLTIQFSENVNASDASFSVECPSGSPVAFSLSASPASSFTLSPGSPLPFGAACQVRVNAEAISDTDSFDPPDQMSEDHTFTFTVASGSATTSTIEASPASITADGSSSSTITVQLRDSEGNALTSSVGPVTLSTTRGTLSGLTDNNDGTWTATLTSSTVAGQAVVSGTLNGASMSSTASIEFVSGPASASESMLTADPESIVADGVTTSMIVVRLQDAFGNPLSSGGSAVAITTTAGSLSNGVTSGLSVQAVDNGDGTYSAILTSPTTAGSAGITATLDSTPIDDSAVVVFTHGDAAKLVFTVQPSDGVAGSAIAPSIEVTVLDAFDNTVLSADGNISLAIANNPGGGSLSGTTSVAAVSGVASFPGISIDAAGDGYTLSAGFGALPSAVSDGFDITAAAFSSFRIASGSDGAIGNQPAGLPFDVRITAIDPFGNTVTSFNGTADLSSAGPMTAGAGTTAAFTSGVLAAHSVSFSSQGTFSIVATNTAGSESGSSDDFYIDAQPAVVSTVPVDLATGVNPATQVTIDLSESVSATVASFEIRCPAASEPLPFVLSPASPSASYVLTPQASLPSGTECSVTVLASAIADVDGALPYSSPAADHLVTFTTNHVPVANADSYTLRAGENHSIAIAEGVRANDTDVEGSDLNVSLVSGASIGTLSLAPDGSFTYDLSAITDEAIVSDSFTYRVNDGISDSNVATVTITILHNAPPVAAADDYDTFEDQELVVAAPGLLVNDSDPDDNISRVILVSGPSAGSFTTPPAAGDDALLDDGSFRYLPPADFVGTVTFTYRLEDSAGAVSDAVTVSIDVTPINDAPFFTPGVTTITIAEDSPAQRIGWATDIRPGPATATDEAGQALTFVTTHTNTALLESAALYCPPGGSGVDCTLTTQPVFISPLDGAIIFQPAANQHGTTTVSVYLQDDGGTADGGVDRFPTAPAVVTFDIVVTAVNDPPSFTRGPHQAVPGGTSTTQTVTNWATNISAGPNEPGQLVSFEVTANSNSGLFATQPAVDPSGTLTYRPTGTTGLATITLRMRDDGGTPGDLSDDAVSPTQTFEILVGNINDPPTFTKGPDVVVNEDSPQSLNPNWATAIHQGGDDPPQTVSFIVTNDNTALFSSQPAIGASNTANPGRLVFTPAANRSGVANVTVVARDNGGVAAGGQDTSAPQTFTITITPVNDPPTFTASNRFVDSSVSGSTPHSVPGWIMNLSAGPFESDQILTRTVVTTAGQNLFTPEGLPAVDDSLTLSFTVAQGTSGTATVEVTITDDGGTPGMPADDLSTTQSYTIHVGVNSPPSFTRATSHPQVLEDTPGTITLVNMITSSSPGSFSGDAGQTVSFNILNNSNPAIFASGPAFVLDTDGTADIQFTLSPNRWGTAVLTVEAQDDGGTANGGVDRSPSQTITITVSNVNDAPSFTIQPDATAARNAGARSVPGFASSISPGPFDPAQTLTFQITANTNTALFTTQPAINSTGTLTFTPANSGTGTQVATITVRLMDNGGTANGGVNVSATQQFTITITDPNAPPVVPNRSITTYANMPLTIGASDTGHRLLDGVTDPEGTSSFTLGTISAVTTGATVQILDPALGTYKFTPRVNTTGPMSFTYQVCDTGFGGLPPACATGTVSVTVIGPIVLFVNASAAAGGDGTFERPLQTLPTTIPANTSAFVYSGTYTFTSASGSISALNNGSRIIGQGGSGTFDATFGIDPSMIPAGSIPARPVMTGSRPLIQRVGTFVSSSRHFRGFGSTFNGGAISLRNLIIDNPVGSCFNSSSATGVTLTIDNVEMDCYIGLSLGGGNGTYDVTNSSVTAVEYAFYDLSAFGTGWTGSFTNTPLSGERLYAASGSGPSNATFNSPVTVQRIETSGAGKSMVFNAGVTVSYPGTAVAVTVHQGSSMRFNGQLAITATDASGRALSVQHSSTFTATAGTNSINVSGTLPGIQMMNAIVGAAGANFQSVIVSGSLSPQSTSLDFQNVSGGNFTISSATLAGCVNRVNSPNVILPGGTTFCP